MSDVQKLRLLAAGAATVSAEDRQLAGGLAALVSAMPETIATLCDIAEAARFHLEHPHCGAAVVDPADSEPTEWFRCDLPPHDGDHAVWSERDCATVARWSDGGPLEVEDYDRPDAYVTVPSQWTGRLTLEAALAALDAS